MKTIHLVSCVAKKLPYAAPAKDLYASDYFKKLRAYVESLNAEWYILSAAHGLVRPEQVIAPYDKTLSQGMPLAERRAWAEQVAHTLENYVTAGDQVVMLAGKRYYEHLKPLLEAKGISVEIPMEGLEIGDKLSWLLRHTPR